MITRVHLPETDYRSNRDTDRQSVCRHHGGRRLRRPTSAISTPRTGPPSNSASGQAAPSAARSSTARESQSPARRLPPPTCEPAVARSPNRLGRDGRFEWRGAPATRCCTSLQARLYVPPPRHPLPDRRRAGHHPRPGAHHLRPCQRRRDRPPAPEFRVVRGLLILNDSTVSWLVPDAAEFADGHYRIKFDEPYAGYALRVEASGFKPAESRVFKPGETTPAFDFVLTPAAPADLLAGIVLRPDGTPAPGVEVALATPDHPLVFENRAVPSSGTAVGCPSRKPALTADSPRPPRRSLPARRNGRRRLRPGHVRRIREVEHTEHDPLGQDPRRGTDRPKAAAGQLISFVRRDRNSQPGDFDSFYHIQTRTDERGRFVFERVIPGPSEVARVVITETGNGQSLHMGCWQEPVDVAPGDIVLARIGGKGRAVVGRIKLPDRKATLFDWRLNRPATLSKLRSGDPVPPGARRPPLGRPLRREPRQGRPVPHRRRPARPLRADRQD